VRARVCVCVLCVCVCVCFCVCVCHLMSSSDEVRECKCSVPSTIYYTWAL